MANWNDISKDIINKGFNFDAVRRDYLHQLHCYTKRNVIIYYSGWLQKNVANLGSELALNDMDKNGFITTIHGLDPSKGLDLVLHSPGGDIAATESIINYLKAIFSNIRVIVPQIAMSCGTMIACSADKIIMGKYSSLGPVDPQYNNIPAHGVVEEFNKAYEEISSDSKKQLVWQYILNKYNPTFLGECIKAVAWSEKMLVDNLKERMFQNDSDRDAKSKIVKEELCNHAVSLSHSRHLSIQKCKEIGLDIDSLENDPNLEGLVLSLHYATMQTLESTAAFKIIENHNGQAFIRMLPIQQK